MTQHAIFDFKYEVISALTLYLSIELAQMAKA